MGIWLVAWPGVRAIRREVRALLHAASRPQLKIQPIAADSSGTVVSVPEFGNAAIAVGGKFQLWPGRRDVLFAAIKTKVAPWQPWRILGSRLFHSSRRTLWSCVMVAGYICMQLQAAGT